MLVVGLASLLSLTGYSGHTDEKEVLPTLVRPMEVQPLFGKANRTIFHPEYFAHVPSILHIWGTWCGPCRHEFTSLLEFSEKNPDVRICAVAWLDDMDSVVRFLKFTRYNPEKHTGMYMVVKEGDLDTPDAKYYQVGTFPTTLFVDKDRNILQRVEGTINWNDKKVQKQVKLFLEGKPFKVEAED